MLGFSGLISARERDSSNAFFSSTGFACQSFSSGGYGAKLHIQTGIHWKQRSTEVKMINQRERQNAPCYQVVNFYSGVTFKRNKHHCVILIGRQKYKVVVFSPVAVPKTSFYISSTFSFAHSSAILFQKSSSTVPQNTSKTQTC